MSRACSSCAQQYPVLDEYAARPSPFVREHIGLDGHYVFHLPHLAEPTGRWVTPMPTRTTAELTILARARDCSALRS